MYLQVAPNGQFAYVLTLNDVFYGIVTGYAINATSGALSPITPSPVGAGPNSNFLALSPNGKFAYVVNNAPPQQRLCEQRRLQKRLSD